MTIISYTVYSQSLRRTIVPWRISPVHPPSTTFRGFFTADIKPQLTQLPCDQLGEQRVPQLIKAYIGKSKDLVDDVDIDLVIADVAPLFGPFVKYEVGQADEPEVSFITSTWAQYSTGVDVCCGVHGPTCKVESSIVL